MHERTRFALIAAFTAGALWGLPGAHAQTGTGKPGQTFRDCRSCPEMVVLPAGKFTMGSPADEPERRENEPQSTITIARAFAMAKTPVTWDQWEACVRDNRCNGAAIDLALRTRENGEPNPDYKD